MCVTMLGWGGSGQQIPGPENLTVPSVLAFSARCQADVHCLDECGLAASELLRGWPAWGQAHRCNRKCPGLGPDCPAWSHSFWAWPPGAGSGVIGADQAAGYRLPHRSLRPASHLEGRVSAMTVPSPAASTPAWNLP